MKGLLIGILLFLLGSGCMCPTANLIPQDLGDSTSSKLASNIVNWNVIMISSEGRPNCGGTVIKYHEHTLVVTANHCLDDFALPGDIQIVEDGTHRFNTEIIISNIHKDIAILRVIHQWDAVGLRSTYPASNEPKIGDKILISGFTAGMKDLVTQGYIGKLLEPMGELYAPKMVLDIRIWYGSSGGGVYNTNGRLIGVVSMIINGPGFCLAVPLQDINEALKESQL